EDTSNEVIVDKLAIARQSLTREMERLLAGQEITSKLIGGIPVDSEYLIFIIDTSGSMFSYAWQRMMNEMESILSIYPDVKGVQILNDMGNYMFSRYRGQWIPDTPGRRTAIMQNLRNWNVFSNSSPVEGINQAIRAFSGDGKKISIYVFGDDFTGNSITEVLSVVDRMNARNAEGQRLVRIHAVGFPVLYQQAPQQQGSVHRFASLMRELTYRNGGTFVGLNDFRP
ncbi:MAG: VWA domain-containing protein, partial [Chromatocurvus sp.]